MRLDHITHQYHSACEARSRTWDTLWSRQSIGRLAVAVTPSDERVARHSAACAELELNAPTTLPPHWEPAWREYLLNDLGNISAQLAMPGDGHVGISIPRLIHGQTQGIAEVYGARVERLPDDNFFVHPLPPEPDIIASLKPQPIEESIYWASVEYARYAWEATEGALPIKAPVMTGPLDTANYLLGSTVLLEWVYSEPEAVKAFLNNITETIIAVQLALKDAAGGSIHPALLWCMRGGPDICSELRAIISADIYAEFEAPYLREIGRRIGPIAIHSCGSWERTVKSALADPNIRAFNGGSREVDVAELCRLADGQMTLSIYASLNCHEDCLWPDRESFWRYLLQQVPATQPFEVSISEEDIPRWNEQCQQSNRVENMAQPA